MRIWNFLKGLPARVWGFFASLPARVWGFFAGLPTRVWNLGRRLVTGTWNWIINFDWVTLLINFIKVSFLVGVWLYILYNAPYLWKWFWVTHFFYGNHKWYNYTLVDAKTGETVGDLIPELLNHDVFTLWTLFGYGFLYVFGLLFVTSCVWILLFGWEHHWTRRMNILGENGILYDLCSWCLGHQTWYRRLWALLIYCLFWSVLFFLVTFILYILVGFHFWEVPVIPNFKTGTGGVN